MVNRIVYYLLILPISYLPYFLLYRVSDFAFFMMFHVLGYRKKVVYGNIKNSFPDKSAKEHHIIAKKFYAHFCDIIVEGLKGFTISEKELNKRFKVRDRTIVDKLYDEGKDIVFVGGHYNNWEILALGVSMQMRHLLIGIYKPLSNKYFDEKMQTSRQRFGMRLCPMRQTKKYFDEDFGRPKGIIFGMDQSPSNPKKAHWMKFLNQDTAVFYGAEKYAKEYNMPVVYGVIHKPKRGYYEAEFKMVTETPNEMGQGEIIEKAHRFLEENINEIPEYWLWTHRRWKHKKPPLTPPKEGDFLP
jgi:KDO2-lipid IV(A) lauroyltransferase